MKFNADFLRDDLEVPYRGDCVIKDKIVDTGRWTINHEVIFEYDGKFYRTYYERGATEQQEMTPWEYEGDEIECQEVKKVEVIKTDWVPVDQPAGQG